MFFFVCALVNLVNMNAKITIALKEDVNLQDIMIWTTNTQIVVMKMRCIINHPPIPPKKKRNLKDNLDIPFFCILKDPSVIITSRS